jgi:hypothetical protein
MALKPEACCMAMTSLVIVVAVTRSCSHTAVCICHELVDIDTLHAQSCAVLQDPETWPEVYGYDSFDHVYLYTLFLGQDARGNMLPVRQLRDRYSQQRQDVYPKEDVSNDDDADKSSPD